MPRTECGLGYTVGWVAVAVLFAGAAGLAWWAWNQWCDLRTEYQR